MKQNRREESFEAWKQSRLTVAGKRGHGAWGRKWTLYEKRPLVDSQQGNGDLRYTAT